MALRVALRILGEEDWLPIPANPYPMYPHLECLNYVALDSATGQRHVFADGPVRVNASIEFKGLSHSFVKKYEAFIIRTKFGAKPFEIECPSYIDFGCGIGKPIPPVYYYGPPTLKDIIKPRDDAGLFYDIELPYMFVKEKF